MAEYGVHHLFSVLPCGWRCLAIFGRDGNRCSRAMESDYAGGRSAHLNEYAATAFEAPVKLGNSKVLH
jgi:hypothetical protein